ncbi:hypothetical protein ELY33_02100 [Vreelandella andesensis]|uniref:Uncharacterized protein n=1 Tax=Vreelandella andesensis TaxID=447567 RepID=A0A3S0XZG5_9GAMM|nr:hypothetical protein [Halomonas andesensis]RUR34041.1 hypothetical protein ELY33_02100 [Halomonas andesensis]
MKINVEFDLTPDEFRQSLGLPDVEAFQQSLLENIQRQMESGVDGYDPMSLMRPFMQQPMMQQGVSQGLANFGTYQQMMLDMLRKAGTSGSSTEQGGDTNQGESQEQEEAKPAATGKSASSARSAKSNAAASSRSRAKG